MDKIINIIVLGNAGSGKSTLAAKLQSKSGAVCLALDDIAFAGGTERRPLQASLADAQNFMNNHEHWLMEGCYADIIGPLLAHAQRLIFLNPGVDACVHHCRQRPWEPSKYSSKAAQDVHLKNLLNWVESYQTRDDEYGLQQHQALFDGFSGDKVMYTNPRDYA